MAFSTAVTYNVSIDAGTSQLFTSTQSYDGSTNIQVEVPATSINYSIICPVTAASVKSVVLWATAACTVVAKDGGGSTVDTFVMTANKPLIWQFGFPTSCPVTGDYATLEVSCTPAVTLTGYFGQDV